jgi:hypothetical protein
MKEEIAVPVPGNDPVSAVLTVPDGGHSGTTGIIFAHGAAFDKNEPLLVHLAEGLAGRGYPSLRFNFPYRDKGRSSPDSQGVLVAAWRAAVAFMTSGSVEGTDRIIAAGKSLGGRVASQMAAQGELPADGLVLLGYPLHPPGKTDQLRDSHLPAIPMPMLFFAGDRDAFADLTLLKQTVVRLDGAQLMVIDGADHAFTLKKDEPTPREAVYDQILKRMSSWLETVKTD